ncbi:MAG TPA: hypothetical protein VGX48_01125 [Pyrinomonadaceae bacterium]|jgi:hypothetical protein|nr:hypothetical protein [Pyrinomonadaceae bacterium]
MSAPGRAVLVLSALALAAALAAASPQAPQITTGGPVILEGPALAGVVPPGFFYAGKSAATQERNSAAARLPRNNYVLAGMVDTSGYAADVREVYQGFFIADTRVAVGSGVLAPGAYGFGFTADGNFTVTDVGGNKLLAVPTTDDTALQRPRPLMMTKSGNSVRLYGGRRFIEISTPPAEPEL